MNISVWKISLEQGSN